MTLIDSAQAWDTTGKIYSSTILTNIYGSSIPYAISTLPVYTSLFQKSLSVPDLYTQIYSEMLGMLSTGTTQLGTNIELLRQKHPVEMDKYFPIDPGENQTDNLKTSTKINYSTNDSRIDFIIDAIFVISTGIIPAVILGQVLGSFFAAEIVFLAALILATFLLGTFESLQVVYNLLKDFVYTLIVDGLFSAIIYIFKTLIPKILALILVKIMDLFSFIYRLPFGIGEKIKKFRDKIWNWIMGAPSTNMTVRQLFILTIACLCEAAVGFLLLHKDSLKFTGITVFQTFKDNKNTVTIITVALTLIIGTIAEVIA